MLKISNKIFEKKFRTRTVYYSEDKYTVAYAHYLIFPIWHTINFWFSPSLPGKGLEGWSPEMFIVSKAEEFAMSFKSIEDVNEYYKKENKKKEEFYIEEKAYYDKNAPYETKTFN